MRRAVLRQVPLKLVDVYESRGAATLVLFELLSKRDPIANISHKRMPTFEEHCAFVVRKPYDAWCLIKANRQYIGATYLTRAGEIGISLFREHQGKGFGPRAVRMLMKRHPRKRFLANISQHNERSIAFFRKLGFTHIQNTYEYEPN